MTLTSRGLGTAAKRAMLKALGYLLFASAAVTFYIKVLRPDATPIEKTGEIVIAHFRGGTIAERWVTPSPSPTPGNH